MGESQDTWLPAFSFVLNSFVNMTHAPSSVNLPCRMKKATPFSESGDLVVPVVMVLLLVVPVEGADGGDGVGGAGAGCGA